MPFCAFPCVLCIVLTNLQNYWAALKKKKANEKERKGESSTFCTYFFVDQITYMKTCNLSGVSANFQLSVRNGQNFTLSNSCSLCWIYAIWITEKNVNPLISQSLIIKIIKWFFPALIGSYCVKYAYPEKYHPINI